MALIEVTKDEFYAVIGPLDVHPRCERDFATWELPNRTAVGKTTPGWMPADAVGSKRYFLNRP